ncbi:STAS domain-containing protein [Streptomyces sp. NPDC126933]|uniref:STAS domain-containing protein n=1 Tax=unclassified Streptomyces TaxID=2593676 RepID=UPI00364BC605
MPSPRTPHNDDHSDPVEQALNEAFAGHDALRDIYVVVARGEIDASNVSQVREALETAAAAHTVVILDTSELRFADSSLLSVLLRVRRTTSLRIAAPPPQLRRLLDISGADQVLRLYPSIALAIDG